MPVDIRIEIGFLDHPKTVKLENRLGPDAFKCLLRLWLFCRIKRPKGILTGMGKEDIEIAAKWAGEPLAFVNALLEFRWIDEEFGVYKIHDWEDHQPWSVGQEDRSRQGREAARVRWDREKKTERNDKPKRPPPPQGRDRPNGFCSFKDCKNEANLVILGMPFCSIPEHRNSALGNILK